MQRVFSKYDTDINFSSQVPGSTVLQVTGTLNLNSSTSRIKLPLGFCSQDGIYTVFDTTAGVKWNGSLQAANADLVNKLIIEPPSGYTAIGNPYLDQTGNKVLVKIRKSYDNEDFHSLSLDAFTVGSTYISRENVLITVYDASTDLQTRTMYYSATLLTPSDFVDRLTTGSFILANGSGSFTKQFALDFNTEGNEVLQFKFSTDPNFKKIVATSPVITVQDLSTSPIFTSNATNVAEGQKIIFSCSFPSTSQGVIDQIYYYTISSVVGNITADDFTDNTLSGSVSISPAFNNRGFAFTKVLKYDAIVEGNESFRISLRKGSYDGDILNSIVMNVADDPLGRGVGVTVNNTTAAIEGVNIDFTVSDANSSINFPSGAYYFITGSANRFDFSDAANSGPITFSGGSATFSKTILNDFLVESESFTTSIVNSLTQYFSLGIFDTGNDGWTGGNAFVYTNGILVSSATLTGAVSGPRYFNFTAEPNDVISFTAFGGSASQTTLKFYTGENGTGQNIYTLSLSANQSVTNSLPAANPAYFDRAYGGISYLASTPSVTVNVTDTSTSNFPGLTLSVSPDSASFDEGTTLNFLLTGSSFYDGTFYYGLRRISGSNSSLAADFDVPTTGTVSVVNGYAALTATILNDSSYLEGNESFIATFQKTGPSITFTQAAGTSGFTSPELYVYEGSEVTANRLARIITATTLPSTYNLPCGILSSSITLRFLSAGSKVDVKVYDSYDGLGTLLWNGMPISSTNYTIEVPNNRYIYATSSNIIVNDTSFVLTQPASEKIPVNTAVTDSTAGTEAGPLNIYYWTEVDEWLFTQAELQAAGLSAGSTISGLWFYQPAAWPWPQITGDWREFIIGMQHTSNQNATLSTVNSLVSNWTTVYYRPGPFAPDTTTYVSLTKPFIPFQNNFIWDGVNSIQFKVARQNLAYTSGGSPQYYNNNGTMLYSRQDINPGYTLATSCASVATYRPKIGLLST